MIIEIYADNLKPQDVKFNQQFFALSLILFKDGRVLLLRDPKEETYQFPKIAYYRESELELALSSLVAAAGVNRDSLVKSVTLHEHFPKRTYIRHYYKIDTALDFSNISALTEREVVWLKDYEALEVLGDYRGCDPWGSQKMERDFIALINSI